MFPSQILSTSSDQYTNKNIQTPASSNDDLWDYAVSQFKLYAYPQMTYEVIVSVNAVTSALGNDKKLNIGDTIIVQDSTFDKSDGGLILSARVSEQEISFTNPLNNKIIFTNFVKLKSAISADLLNKMQELAKQNAPYRSEIDTSNGVQFVNGVGSTTLTARIYLGADPNETIADSYQWSKDGTLVANVQEITVDASGISEKAVYTYQALINGNVVASQSVTITNVNDGTAGRTGADGKTQYTHIAYANSADGTANFSTSDSNRTYIGMYVDFNINDSNTPGDYSWTLVKGADGTQGTPGKPGADGKTPYFHTAWSYSADGTDRFTTVYPNLNLLDGTKDFSGTWTNSDSSVTDGTYKGLTVKKRTGQWNGIYKTFTAPKDGTYTFSAYIKSSGNTANIIRFGGVNSTSAQDVLQKFIGNNFDWTRDIVTLNLKANDSVWIKYEISSADAGSILWTAGHKWEQGSTATPYMQSASEVTTADWPSYIGQYTDFTQADSTNPSTYTWSLIRGNDGKDGKDGKNGMNGTDGNPGKIVSDTEPTTKFKGLTWKYSGVTAINASDGTSIQPSTEYYWNDKNWVLNQINAHNINVDDLSAISTTLTNGKFISNWSSDNASGTTTIEKNHFIINSANASLNTENTIALDNEQGMMMTYNNKTNKQTISVGVNFQGLFVTDSTGPYVSVTPTGIVNSVDVSWTTIGSYAAYRRDGRVVTIRVVGAKTSAIGNIYIGTIPLKDCPAASIMGTALAWSASVANDKHIQINGLNQQNSGGVTILSAAANQEYTFQFTYQI
ncbi:hypothetical protein MK801_05045 [Lactococcus lactis]|uniref:hypothetical protein n=1 Tax=Lactococcus lactis TaxID=1358 RepID=UPI0020B6658C|nr:hypothetical protein MK801_05045 [Lactococcus lactis]